MNWQAFLDSPLATWVPILALAVFILLLFRKQIGTLIVRLTKGSVETGKDGVKVHIETPPLSTPDPKPTPLAVPPTGGPVKPLPSPIPFKAYRRLIGRQAELDDVMTALRQPKEKQMIALTGLGGIGKTALAHEIIERSLAEGLFDFVVWTSAKTERFVGESTRKVAGDDLSFDSLIEAIGRQCDRLDILEMKKNEKQAAVQALLARKRVVVVVDNLDTVPDYEAIVSKLYTILGQSKALFTSRYKLKHEQVYTVSLGGLDVESGRDFLRDEAQARNVAVIVTASKTRLNKICKVTGGAPLAMKLVVGQMSRLPMEEVLDTLERASIKGQDREFYTFVYRNSWKILDMDARKALVGMSVFPAITGGAVEDVKEAITGNAVENEKEMRPLESSAFGPAMDQLVTMSLVDKTGSAGRERYALHPLTQYFVKSDITKEWAGK